QAEVGIRDFHVTGVQTCALPILADTKAPSAMLSEPTPRSPTVKERTLFQCEPVPVTRTSPLLPAKWPTLPLLFLTMPPDSIVRRSEERRIGKECRCGWSP